MNLSEATVENLSFIVHSLADSLQVINRAILDPKDFDLSSYNELKSIYEMVQRQGKLSVPEIQAIIEELRKLRSK
jgi:uncharacterized protein YfkK (UPF0435 family)